MRFFITHNSSSIFSKRRYRKTLKIYSSSFVGFYDVLFALATPTFLLYTFNSTTDLVYLFLPIWIDCCFSTFLDWIVIFRIFQITTSLIVRFFLLVMYFIAPILTYIFEARPFVLILDRYSDTTLPSSLTILDQGSLLIHFIPIILYLGWIMLKMVRYPIKNRSKQKSRKRRDETESEEEQIEEKSESSMKTKKADNSNRV